MIPEPILARGLIDTSTLAKGKLGARRFVTSSTIRVSKICRGVWKRRNQKTCTKTWKSSLRFVLLSRFNGVRTATETQNTYYSSLGETLAKSYLLIVRFS